MARRDGTVSAVLVGATCALAGCGDRIGLAPVPTLSRALAPFAETARLVPTLPPAIVSGVAGAAAIAPRRISLPHAEIGGQLGHRPETLALEFAAKAGQVLEVRLERSSDVEPTAPAVAQAGLETEQRLAPLAIAVPAAPARAAQLRVLIVDDDLAAPRYAELAAPGAGASELFLRLPADAEYVVELRPPGSGLYRIALELHAPLPFPVAGYDYRAIESHFGASRDSGSRRHEGVDIHVPSRTPVVAVADGLVGLHVEGRGGIAIVLSVPGISYYYAHLERTAVGDGQRVRVGDVLGYVGSTGNARGTAPHLHFGVYEFGKGAIDPLPLLEERRFAEADDAREPFPVVAATLADEEDAAFPVPDALSTVAASASGGGTVFGMDVAVAAVAGCGAGFVTETYVGFASAATIVGEWSLGADRRSGSLAPNGAAVLCIGGT